MHPVKPLTLVLLAGVVACGEPAQQPPELGIGPNPRLPAPNTSLIPTVLIAPAKGWPAGATPKAVAGLVVSAFARDLNHPRWLLVLPNGDVLAAESNAPPKGEGVSGGFKGWVMKLMMSRAGAGVPSANRITLLRDVDGDGVAEVRSPFIEGLNSPFGMALIGNDLYVANADAVLRYSYTPGDTRIAQVGTKVLDLPGGPINHHWTKNLIASRDGSKLYITVGSNSNVAEHGMEIEEGRAAIWELDLPSGKSRRYASGLRNPNGMAFEAETGRLWTVVNERDELGSDLVPDYLTSVKDGGFYGWPYSYFGANVDARVQPPRPDLVAQALKPDFALGSHVAPLGLAAGANSQLPEPFRNGMFIGLHGSWNRKPLAGYKVVFAPFSAGKPNGPLLDVLTGFVDDDGRAQGRPVGVAIDAQGGLLVADDVGNTVWRVKPGRAPG